MVFDINTPNLISSYGLYENTVESRNTVLHSLLREDPFEMNEINLNTHRILVITHAIWCNILIIIFFSCKYSQE